ncbi:MAG: DUF763 domain-containing protein [Candidatus Altiarchaeales archaeon]|nr:MAG: DUF763 domain-containing protein [Candidatus Altiarchaeales archaeon]HDO82174.1 DUF763 domain-containing protein [Candidatus Altiarchaeales archaeon]HEX54823.1 DUF763 domain-containing protein [Candidatus Altiarchaeales archaeon]
MKKTGTANLPLHYGRTPRWLFNRMVSLASEITEILVYEYGQREFLRRISNPYWFQAFSCVLGFDWHSSGTTTTTCGALKIAVDAEKFGIKVVGGKGKTSRKTPEEIEETADLFSLSTRDVERLKYASKMAAKVDNACVQDSYQLYHHCFIFTEKGDWAVVQQGMSDRYARRYHWISENVNEFVNEPHSGICADRFERETLDMTAKESEEARKISVDLVNDGPEHISRFFSGDGQKLLLEFDREFTMPPHHPILDIDIGRDGMKILKKAYEIQPQNYEELIALKGMGPKRIRALALISELVYGAEPSWRDPAKFSFAHGGKDGHPFPVNKRIYDKSIETLRDAIEKAKIGEKEKLYAIKRLRDFISD